MVIHDEVIICEVGLRDGLQAEKIALSVQDKVTLAQKLSLSGIPRVELGSFVRTDLIPQMSGTEDVVRIMRAWAKEKGITTQFSVLVPNLKGLEKALSVNVEEIAIFASVTEKFSLANLNASRHEVRERLKLVCSQALSAGIKVRGYLSVVFGCPYEGQVRIDEVLGAVEELLNMGCYEISLGDTIGVAHAGQVQTWLSEIGRRFPLRLFAGHFHDTRGQALSNILVSYQMGIRVFDASFGGFGGCPYAPRSTGNVATEEVLYLFQGLGQCTSIDMHQLLQAADYLSQLINRPLPSRLARSGLGKRG
ncbi:MAG: hydroxymethylglutaryl-CoA lyase [Bdellovibrionaceae bacterium]|nr:hydroxymethylglutaryl-CoA lyase [Pseudobdellovibrionaceae bacterium]MDW8191012.1 hydroxymethylglutaryl-CoA lyase [Pseudobdellovibrionaceae bacterium]